ncbi:unnamed protein product [Owenia fusiformis]|uniref:Uncharacterized protein n=1 Tax=Owenia fusiformis TaxID=6347 RepID=A0A8J1U423_OWEFU|nr:unnamed protein product [Owenia fusiformis]
MEKFHQKIITSLTRALQDDIVPLARFYGNLLAKEIFTDEMIDQIKTEKTTSEQNLKMLTLLKTRAGVFYKFCEVLEETSHEDLAKLLRDAEFQRREVMTTPNLQMQEFFSKHLAMNRRLCEEDKRLIITNLATKDELTQEKRALVAKVDENARLNYQVNTLHKKVTSLNEKLDTSLKVNNDNKVEVDILKLEIKQLQDDIETRDAEIKQLGKEKMDLEDRLNENTNGSPRIVKSLEQELKDQATIVETKNEQIAKLKGQLDIKQIALKEIHIQFELHKHEQEEKIKEINEKLQAVTNYKPSDNLPVDSKHMFILHMNMEFVARKIESLQKDLLEANNAIIKLQTEQEMAADMLGFDKIENNLVDTVERFMNIYKTETDDQKIKIDNLKRKLKEAKKEKLNLQSKLDELKVDGELMKNSVKLMKRKYLDSKLGTNKSRGSSASDSRSSGGDITPLPDVSKELSRITHRAKNHVLLRKSTSTPTFQDPTFGSTFPKILNLSVSQNSSIRTPKNSANSLNEKEKSRPRSRHLSIDRLTSLEEDSSAKKICVICHNKYIVFHNTESACRYHKGQYGNSELAIGKRWSCCFKADEKSVGCCKGLHRSHNE